MVLVDGKVLPAVQVEMSSEQQKTWVWLSGEGPRLQSRFGCLRTHVRPQRGRKVKCCAYSGPHSVSSPANTIGNQNYTKLNKAREEFKRRKSSPINLLLEESFPMSLSSLF